MDKCSTKNFNDKQRKEKTEECESKVTEGGDYFFIYYSRTNKTVRVGKQAFSKIQAKTIVFKFFKLKVIGDMERERVKQKFKGFKAQGITEIASLFMNIIGKTSDVINGFNHGISKINKKFCIIISKLLLEFSSFSSDFAGKRVDQFINIILSVYSLVDHFSAEGIESFVLAGLFPFFPKCVQDLFKHLQLFTNVKVSDDFTLIHQLFEKTESFITYVMDKIGAPPALKETVLRCFSYLGFGEKHVILNKMEQMIAAANKNPKEFLKKEFCSQALLLNERFQSCAGIHDWRRKSGSVKEECEKWERFIKIVRANLDSSRQEPNLFVFQGPPGIGKSIFLNQVVSSLGWSCYSHVVPDVNEGRDFYDSYNNEDVFYMDDVGQKGVSQWRTMINMISSVKLPLDCAEAKLKDTKFFNSHTVLVTTNEFTGISGLMRNDGISDVTALWRRGFVFDCTNLKREDGMFKGSISFKRYDLNSKKFESNFPSYFKYKIPDTFRFETPTNDLHQVRVWMGAIIKGFQIIKEEMKRSYDLTESMKQQTQEDIESMLEVYSDTMTAQGGTIENFLQSAVSAVGVYFGCLTAHRIARMLYDEFQEWYYLYCTIDIDDAEIQRQRDDLLFTKVDQLMFLVQGLVIITAIYSLINLVSSFLSGEEEQQEVKIKQKPLVGEGFSLSTDFSATHNSVNLIKNHVFEVDIMDSDEKVACCALVSGRLLFIPEHMSMNASQKFKIYKNRSQNHVIVDWITANLIYSNTKEDICIYELPSRFPNPFKTLSNWICKDSLGKTEEFLVTPWGYSKISTEDRLGIVCDYAFKTANKEKVMSTKADYFTYNTQQPGMCGSPIFSVTKGLLGFHVAGNAVQGIGVGSCWSSELKKVLLSYIENDKPLVKVPFELSLKNLENQSVCKLENGVHISQTPSTSSIEPSSLYGIYPVSRYPADLTKYGNKTLSSVASKSFKNCASFPKEELEFAQIILDQMIEPFGVLSDKEVVSGTNLLAPLNKKSSNGFGCFKEKDKYIDFQNEKPTEMFKEELEKIEKDALSGDVDYKKLLWFECLKDEVRNEEKEGVPRSFRVGTIHQQFLVKKYFGRMVEHIMRNRDFNKIMVGCNPIEAWPAIYDDMKSGRVFAGDIKNWDGGMNPMLQEMIAEKLVERSTCKNKQILQALVGTLTNSIVIVERDLYITTHSMPSGSYLTAIMNSIVNKLYTAIWYYRYARKPTALGFWTDVSDYVYGDDKLNVVRKDFENLNAISMEKFFSSIGLGFTDANKCEIKEPFQSVDDVSFLKRTFRYHSKLKKIVCPLELRVIQNTLSYYNSDKIQSVVLADKIHAVQREMYLHEDHIYLLKDLYERLKKFKVHYVQLPLGVLESYFLDPNCEIPLSFSNNLYI